MPPDKEITILPSNLPAISFQNEKNPFPCFQFGKQPKKKKKKILLVSIHHRICSHHHCAYPQSNPLSFPPITLASLSLPLSPPPYPSNSPKSHPPTLPNSPPSSFSSSPLLSSHPSPQFLSSTCPPVHKSTHLNSFSPSSKSHIHPSPIIPTILFPIQLFFLQPLIKTPSELLKKKEKGGGGGGQDNGRRKNLKILEGLSWDVF